MRTRGPVAAALVTLALLSGCASFADSVEEASDVAVAAATTEPSGDSTSGGSSASASASASGSASGSASASAATTTAAPQTSEAAATTGSAPRPTGTAAPGSAAPPERPAGGWPPETTLTAYREAWGVYLSVAKDYTDAEAAQMEKVYRDLQSLGYRGYYGTLCDAGAEEAGVGESDDAVAVYFSTKAQADQFIDGWNRSIVGYARVATFCTD